MFLLGALSSVADAIGSGAGTGGLNLQLNAGAIAPEAAVLIALLTCLLVDLAGEKAASRWVPPICYAGLGSALVLLALQWNTPDLQPAFVGERPAGGGKEGPQPEVSHATLLTLTLEPSASSSMDADRTAPMLSNSSFNSSAVISGSRLLTRSLVPARQGRSNDSMKHRLHHIHTANSPTGT